MDRDSTFQTDPRLPGGIPGLPPGHALVSVVAADAVGFDLASQIAKRLVPWWQSSWPADVSTPVDMGKSAVGDDVIREAIRRVGA